MHVSPRILFGRLVALQAGSNHRGSTLDGKEIYFCCGLKSSLLLETDEYIQYVKALHNLFELFILHPYFLPLGNLVLVLC